MGRACGNVVSQSSRLIGRWNRLPLDVTLIHLMLLSEWNLSDRKVTAENLPRICRESAENLVCVSN